MTNTQVSAAGSAQPSGRERVPFAERLTCSIADATEVSGLSRSTIYLKMKTGELEWLKIDKRRLIRVSSLKRLLGVA